MHRQQGTLPCILYFAPAESVWLFLDECLDLQLFIMWWANSAQHVAWWLSTWFPSIWFPWDPRQQRFLKGKGLQKHLSAAADECFRKFSVSDYALQHLFHCILELVLRWEKMDFACNMFLHITYNSHWSTYIRQQHTSVVVAAFDWHRESQEGYITHKAKEETESTLVKWQKVGIYSYQKYRLRNGNLILVMLMEWKLIFCLCLTCQSGSRIKGNFKSK